MSHDALEILLLSGGIVGTVVAYFVGWSKGWGKAMAFYKSLAADPTPVAGGADPALAPHGGKRGH